MDWPPVDKSHLSFCQNSGSSAQMGFSKLSKNSWSRPWRHHSCSPVAWNYWKLLKIWPQYFSSSFLATCGGSTITILCLGFSFDLLTAERNSSLNEWLIKVSRYLASACMPTWSRDRQHILGWVWSGSFCSGSHCSQSGQGSFLQHTSLVCECSTLNKNVIIKYKWFHL